MIYLNDNELQNFFDAYPIDGMSLYDLEKLFKINRIGLGFQGWGCVWRNYTGLALPDILYKIYDAAQTVLELKQLWLWSFGVNAELKALTEQSMDRMSRGLPKLSRDPLHLDRFTHDNFIMMLELLSLEVDNLLSSFGSFERSNESTKFDLDFSIRHFFQFFNMQYSPVLHTAIGLRKEDPQHAQRIQFLIHLHAHQVSRGIHKDPEHHKTFFITLKDAIQSCLQYEKNRLSHLENIYKQQRFVKSKVNELYDQLKAYKYTTKVNKPTKPDEKKIKRLRNEIQQYEIKYQKAAKSNIQSKMKALAEFKAKAERLLEEELAKESPGMDQQSLERLSLDHLATQEKVERVEHQYNIFTSLKCPSVTATFDLAEWMSFSLKRLEILSGELNNIADILNGSDGVDRPDLVVKEDIYNAQRDNYIDHVYSTLNTAEQCLRRYDFDDQSIPVLLNALSRITPIRSAIDTKAMKVSELLKDLTGEYHKQLDQGIKLDSSANIVKRLQLVVDRCFSIMTIVDSQPRFSLLVSPNTLGKYSPHFDPSDVLLDDGVPMLEHLDETIDEDQIYPYLVHTLEQLHAEEILSDLEYIELKQSLDHDLLRKFEQLIGFEFDEFKNSVENSLRTVRRYKSLGKPIPDVFKSHMLASFCCPITRIPDNKIPNQHPLYSYLDDEDKVELITIIKRLFNLNNSLENIHFKLALSLHTCQDVLFDIKQDMFQWSLSIAHKHIYGTYSDNAQHSKKFTKQLISHFKAFTTDLFKSLDLYTICWTYFQEFQNAFAWYLMNFSTFGGYPLRINNTVTPVTERGLLLQTVDPNQIAQLGWSYELDFIEMLKEETSTIFKLLNLDLRFRAPPSVPKYTTAQQYLDRLSDIAKDLVDMRRLLVKNYKPEETIIDLNLNLSDVERKFLRAPNGTMHVMWQWETNGDGLGRLCLDGRREHIETQAKKASRMDATYFAVIRVNRNGRISPIYSPWLDAAQMDLVGVEAALDFNLYVLELIHEKFLEKYVSLAEKVKRRVQRPTTESSTTDDVVYDQYDVDVIAIQDAVQHINQKTDHDEPNQDIHGTASGKARFDRSLKSNQFFKILKEKFDVKISQGKGSEINVSRVAHGGRNYRLGHHGKVVSYNAVKIRDVLARLNISLDDWVAACS